MIRVLFSLFFTIVVGFSTSMAASTSKVLMIHSYPKGIWYNGLVKGASSILNNVTKKYQIDNILYDYEKLRFKSLKEQNKRIEEIVAYVNEVKPEFLIINDDEAIKKIYPKIPKKQITLLNGLNQLPSENKDYSSFNLAQKCGIVEYYPIKQSLDMVSLMGKDIKQMSVISSDGESSKIVSQIFKGLQKTPYKNFKVRKVVNEKYWDNWKKALKDFEMNDDLIWLLVPFEVFKDKKNHVKLTEMASWIRKNVRKPLLGILSVHTKMGFLSAISVTPEGLGRQIAEMVLKIEKGKTCKSIGFEKSKYHNFEVNTSEIKRLNLKVPVDFMGVATFLDDSEIFK